MRSTLDKIFAAIGILLALALAIGAALLFWASNFVGDQMRQNLTEQNITMPTDKTGLAQLPQADQDALRPYAGTPLDNGDKAKAYADHFIGVHMKEQSQGRTFSQVGEERRQKCQGANAQSKECQDLQALGQTLFQGNTLRGLLTFGYAFGTMGKIANIAAWVATLGSLLFLILGLLGFNHARKEKGREVGHVERERVATTHATGTTGHVGGTDGATRA